MTQVLFLRVGIDTGCGGALSPYFEDGRFEYVPIPESKPLIAGREVVYEGLQCRSGGAMHRHSGRTGPCHHDPEFDSFTYGEPNEPKRSQLLRLQSGDHLVFYAGMQGPTIARGTCCVIGYFIVSEVHRPPAVIDRWPPASLDAVKDNAHLRRLNPESTLVIVRGDPRRSKLLDRALPLSDASRSRLILPDVAQQIGINGSVLRAVGRWVPPTHAASAVAWLHSHEACRPIDSVSSEPYSGDRDRGQMPRANVHQPKRLSTP